VLLDEMGRFKGFTNLNNIVVPDEEETESYEKIIDREVIRMRKAEFFDSLSASIGINTINELSSNTNTLKAYNSTVKWCRRLNDDQSVSSIGLELK